jgi:hypothetical protein
MTDSVPEVVAEAVRALLSGAERAGRRLLLSLDEKVLEAEKERARLAIRVAATTQLGAMTLVPHGGRTPPPKVQMRLFANDGYVCRYQHCQRKTIIPPVFRALSVAYPRILRWNKNWRGTHPVVWLYTSSVEHVIPWSLSRSSHMEENLITTCYWDNQLKSKRRHEDIGWTLSKPSRIGWSGLSELAKPLIERVWTAADESARRYFAAWVAAIPDSPRDPSRAPGPLMRDGRGDVRTGSSTKGSGMPKEIYINEHRLDVGDQVRARHYMPKEERWSADKRNYIVTSLDPLMGRELWEGGGGKPRQEWKLTRQGIELVRPRRPGRKDK